MHDDRPAPHHGVDGDDIEIEFVEVDPETGLEADLEVSEQPPEEPGTGDTEVDRLHEVIDQMQLELNQVRDHYLRKLAEFDNFRKRMEREREELQRTASELLVRELIPVLDNFDRAVKHASDSDFESFQQGVEMIAKQLWDVLEREGLETLDPTGKPFQPEFHEAVQRVNDPARAPGTVAWTLAKGYLFGGRMLRPAMVGVVVPGSAEASHGAAPTPPTAGEGEGRP